MPFWTVEGAESGSGHASDQGAQRRAELLGAAAGDDLTAVEQQELDAMCARDPQLAQELEELREFSSALRRGVDSWRDEAPSGTLGPLEPLKLSDRGVDVDGMLIPHSRGTETVLQIEGLPAGETFTVALVAADGQEVESETLFGSDASVECRMTGPMLREDVQRLEIRDDAGLAVLAAELSTAE